MIISIKETSEGSWDTGTAVGGGLVDSDSSGISCVHALQSKLILSYKTN